MNTPNPSKGGGVATGVNVLVRCSQVAVKLHAPVVRFDSRLFDVEAVVVEPLAGGDQDLVESLLDRAVRRADLRGIRRREAQHNWRQNWCQRAAKPELTTIQLSEP